MNYVSDITKKTYAKGAFLVMLEKRIRKHLRIDHSIDLKSTYVILNRDDVASEVLMYFLETIFSKRLVIRFIDSLSEQKKEEKLLSAQYLEEFIGKKLEIFFTGSKISGLLKTNTPLRVLSAKEINQVSKILSLEGKPVTNTNKFIEKLQEKYPQTKTSLLKSFDNISSELFAKK